MSRRESIRPPSDGTWLRAVLDAMVEAVLVVDQDGRIALTNRALDALTSEDVRGKRAKNVIKNERLREAMRDARKKARATEVEIEASVRGRVRVFRASISPLPKRAGAVAVLHDVTPLKDADRMRRDFVANASHELRTPLTSIRGFAETLADQHRADGAITDAATTAKFLDAILRQTKRLQRLAEDLALLARAESSEEALPSAIVDLRKVADHVALTLAAFAAEQNVRVRVEAPRLAVRAHANGEAVEQVLTNLVENAIKHSKPRGHVVIAIQGVARTARVEVRDRGHGIAAEHHARIFERFYRVDAGRARSVGGTGLGLAIVKHLVERMRGTVEVQSALGKGSTFRITLPRGRVR